MEHNIESISQDFGLVGNANQTIVAMVKQNAQSSKA